MKTISIFTLMIVSSFAFSQKSPVYKIMKDKVQITRFHDNGAIKETGFISFNEKLEGEWISYNLDGKKVIEANYKNGKKDGDWIFYMEDSKFEVTYDKNKIIKVEKLKSYKKLQLAQI